MVVTAAARRAAAGALDALLPVQICADGRPGLLNSTHSDSGSLATPCLPVPSLELMVGVLASGWSGAGAVEVEDCLQEQGMALDSRHSRGQPALWAHRAQRAMLMQLLLLPFIPSLVCRAQTTQPYRHQRPAPSSA